MTVGEGKDAVVPVDGSLWFIGGKDGDWRDIFFSADQNHATRSGADFTIGSSDPAKDWPAVQPGPRDGWAGEASRTNVVKFTIPEKQSGREASLTLKLIDAHRTYPPMLEIELNGNLQQIQITAGRSDESIKDPEKGVPFRQSVVFPKGALKPGENVLKIRSREGSWLVYDGLEFQLL